MNKTGNMSLLTLENISMYYNHNLILDDISLTINSGDFIALIGPSGAGKSTLLRLVNLLEQPTGGTIYYKNQQLDYNNSGDILKIRRNMTMVMQRSIMLSGTVASNVATGLKLRKIPKDIIHSKVQESLSFVGMADLANRNAASLSGGEMQRVALARAIALEPEILLLDEPTANLDPQNVMIIESLLADIKERLGTTIIMVTHNIFQGERVSNKAVFMHQGKVIEEDYSSQLFTKPNHPLTQGFISGTMVY